VDVVASLAILMVGLDRSICFQTKKIRGAVDFGLCGWW